MVTEIEYDVDIRINSSVHGAATKQHELRTDIEGVSSEDVLQILEILSKYNPLLKKEFQINYVKLDE